MFSKVPFIAVEEVLVKVFTVSYYFKEKLFITVVTRGGLSVELVPLLSLGLQL